MTTLTPQQKYHQTRRWSTDPVVREAYQEAIRLRKRRYYEKLKSDVIQAYGGRCACCGETERVFLCVDHKHGGGNKHRRSFGDRGVTQYVYREIRRQGYPSIYQVLCHNCNHAKDQPGGCPHQKES